MKVPTGSIYEWTDDSTYIKQPPYFEQLVDPLTFVRDLQDLRALGDAGRLRDYRSHFARRFDSGGQSGRKISDQLGVKPGDFNSYGARRGNHEVMVRGTFANIRLRNQMVPGCRRRLDAAHAGRREDVYL